MDEQELTAVEHRHEGRGIEAGQKHVLRPVRAGREQAIVRQILERQIALIGRAARPGRTAAAAAAYSGRSAEIARLAKRVAEQDIGRTPASTGIACPFLAQLDELEQACPGD